MQLPILSNTSRDAIPCVFPASATRQLPNLLAIFTYLNPFLVPIPDFQSIMLPLLKFSSDGRKRFVEKQLTCWRLPSQSCVLVKNTSRNSSIRWLIFLYLLVFGNANAQDADWLVPGNKWYTESKNIEWLLATYQPIYNFRPKDKIASIGAGQGVREVVFSLMADSLSIYVQDINPHWLEPDKLAVLVRKVYNEANRAGCTTTFVPVRGGSKATKLPERFFDKIIIENSLHEFDFQDDMLKSIRVNLMPDGYLFIWEAMASNLHSIHSDCGKPMFTDTSLVKLLTENGFSFVDKTVIMPKRWNNVVYMFRLTGTP